MKPSKVESLCSKSRFGLPKHNLGLNPLAEPVNPWRIWNGGASSEGTNGPQPENQFEKWTEGNVIAFTLALKAYLKTKLFSDQDYEKEPNVLHLLSLAPHLENDYVDASHLRGCDSWFVVVVRGLWFVVRGLWFVVCLVEGN